MTHINSNLWPEQPVKPVSKEKSVMEDLSIQTILLSFADPTNNGAGHHNIVFAERQIEALIAQREKLARKANELDGRIVGMHELEATFKFEGMPLTQEQRDSKRNYVQQLEAQLQATEKGSIRDVRSD